MTINKFGMGLCVATLSASCMAVVNGYSPSTTSQPNPSTGLQTQNWRFVGSVAGVSAVQITPRFILASRHAMPSAGTLFVNDFGQSTVTSCENPTTSSTNYMVGSPNDVSLCLLSSAINPNVDFPPLVDRGNISTFNNNAYHHWGNIYMVGFAGGSRHAAWAAINGIPPNYDVYDLATTPIGASFDTSGLIPYLSGGDSGGAAYWFPPNSTVGALQGILTLAAGADSAFSRFTPDILDWVQNRIQSAGQSLPTRLDIAQFYPSYQSQFPRMMSADSVSTTITGATSATITWISPDTSYGDSTAPITQYFVRLQAPGETGFLYKSTNAPGTWSLSNLADGQTYQACVLTGNALGYGPNAYLLSNKTIKRPGCKTLIAGQPNFVADAQYDITRNAAGGTDLSAWWTTPASNGVAIGSYRADIQVWPRNAIGGTPPSATYTVTTSTTNFNFNNVAPRNKRVCWRLTSLSVSGVANTAPDNYTQCFLTLD